MSLIHIGAALGGIGLFLLGMRLMTEGLKVAAGPLLNDLLTRWTRSRLRALSSGFLITAVVQSSSAVTVAAIGFVNAGALTLAQAIWVIFGSNVGTTVTGWIVSATGFDIRIEAYALPLLGIGMLLSLSGRATRRGALGEAVAGFGVFFLGIATLKATFGGLGESIDIAAFAAGGIWQDAVFVLVGVVLTSLVQSSSAVIAITLTATAGMLITLESGAALVIGANLGSTTTALLAVIGATPNAKRVALGHVAFNLLTGLVALALLPALLAIVELLERTFDPIGNPVLTLALFHTVFNVFGLILMWPISGRLTLWLSHRFVTQEEDESRPRHLDRNTLEMPGLAINGLYLELTRIATVAAGIIRPALLDRVPPTDRLWLRRRVIVDLGRAVGDFARLLYAKKVQPDVAEAMAHPFRALQQMEEMTDLALGVAALKQRLAPLDPDIRNAIDGFATVIAADMDGWLGAVEARQSRGKPDDTRFKNAYRVLKDQILVAARRPAASHDAIDAALDTLDGMREIHRLLWRTERRLAAIAGVVEGRPAATPEDTETLAGD